MALQLMKALAQKAMTTPITAHVGSSIPRAMAPGASNLLGHSQRFLSSSEKLPEEEYHDGHLLTDHLEYMDDMIDKTMKIEAAMQGLRDTHAQKRQAYKDSASLEEMERLFLQAEDQKLEISNHLESLRAILIAKRSASHAPYAVDGPDGSSDVMEADRLQGMASINKDMATHSEHLSQTRRRHETEKVVAQERARDPEHDW